MSNPTTKSLSHLASLSISNAASRSRSSRTAARYLIRNAGGGIVVVTQRRGISHSLANNAAVVSPPSASEVSTNGASSNNGGPSTSNSQHTASTNGTALLRTSGAPPSSSSVDPRSSSTSGVVVAGPSSSTSASQSVGSSSTSSTYGFFDSTSTIAHHHHSHSTSHLHHVAHHHHHHHHHAGVSSVGVGKHAFHSSAYSAHQIQPQASSASIHSPPPPPPSAIGVGKATSSHLSSSSSSASSPPSPSSSSSSATSDSGPGVLSLSSHHHHNQNPSQSPFTSNPSSSSSSTTTSSSSSSLVSSSTQPTSQPSSSNSTTTSDRATLFTSHTPASFPNHPLPSFFGTSLNIARRSNLVFRNGAYGIPKAKVGGESNKKNAATAAAAAAAAAKGKGKEVDSGIKDEPEHALSVGVGEDAYFLRTDSLGVADGVGGWSGHAGANPARWSRKFMHHCSSELARYENVEDELFLQYYEVDPVEVLQRAFEKTLAECKEEGVIGSSTALIAVLRNDELRLANMGDCCCSIIRGNDYVFRSEEQQHSFNYPFQAGTTSKDTPIKDAQRFTIKVQKDDIVILSSDGLCDNLFTDDVLEEVLRFVAESPPPTIPVTGSAHPGSRYQLNRFSPQAVSEALCHRAKSVYEDQRAVSSPFALRAMEEGIHFAGGKRDDITTLIGVVGELEASPDRR